MSLKFEPRREIPKSLVYGTPLLAIALTILSGYLLFMFLGLNPGSTLYIFLVSPLETQFGLAELAVKAGPLILIATGLAIGFRANVWNIGAEGQLTIGAIFGAGVALAFWGDEGFWILPLMFVAGALGGMLWAAIPAFLKTKFEVSEILTSLMLTYVATLVLSILVHGPWRDPEGFNFPQSRLFTEAAILPIVLEGTRLHAGAFVALFAAVAAWVEGDVPRAVLPAAGEGRRVDLRGALLIPGPQDVTKVRLEILVRRSTVLAGDPLLHDAAPPVFIQRGGTGGAGLARGATGGFALGGDRLGLPVLPGHLLASPLGCAFAPRGHVGLLLILPDLWQRLLIAGIGRRTGRRLACLLPTAGVISLLSRCPPLGRPLLTRRRGVCLLVTGPGTLPVSLARRLLTALGLLAP